MKHFRVFIFTLLIALFLANHAQAFEPRKVDEINIILAQRSNLREEGDKVVLEGQGSAYVGPWDGTIGSGTNDYPLLITIADPDAAALKKCRDAVSGDISKDSGIMLSGPGTYRGGPSDDKDRQKPLTITIDKIEICNIDLLPGAAVAPYTTPGLEPSYDEKGAELARQYNESLNPPPPGPGWQEMLSTFMYHFELQPVAVSLYLLAGAALLLSPLVPLFALVRGYRNRTIQGLDVKILSVFCLVGAIACVVEGFRGSGKEDNIWFAVAPALIAAAPFLWLDRLEKRHRAALICLVAAVLGLALLVLPFGGAAFLLILPAVLVSAITAVIPPYLALGRCDILSRAFTFLACMAAFSFWIVVGLWQMVANVTR